MTWYNPLSWSRRENVPAGELELRCDNPQCGSVLKEEFVQYDPERKKIYHLEGDCVMESIALEIWESDEEEILTANTRSISREKALRLLRAEKLQQAGYSSE